ncbi:MAG: PilZ domain-containing protein [Pseudomonadota bacterium]
MDNYHAHDLTAVSFNPVVPAPPERRTEERQTTLLRVGKLVTAGDERLCMIRNISSAGAMIKLYQPIAVGAAVAVEVTPDCPVAATVIWVQDECAGIAFDVPIDVVAALRGEGQAGPYRRVARTPRLQVRRPALMHTDEIEREVMLCDLSLNGAKIETDAALASDVEVALFVDGLPPLSGRIRWCHDARAGMEFDIPVQMDVLAAWMGGGEAN